GARVQPGNRGVQVSEMHGRPPPAGGERVVTVAVVPGKRTAAGGGDRAAAGHTERARTLLFWGHRSPGRMMLFMNNNARVPRPVLLAAAALADIHRSTALAVMAGWPTRGDARELLDQALTKLGYPGAVPPPFVTGTLDLAEAHALKR